MSTEQERSSTARLSSEKLCRAVLAVEKIGVLSPEALMVSLRVSPGEARLLAGALVAAGWAKPVREPASCPCSRCPFARFCPFARTASKNPRKLYIIDRGAVERCRRLLSQNKPISNDTKSDN